MLTLSKLVCCILSKLRKELMETEALSKASLSITSCLKFLTFCILMKTLDKTGFFSKPISSLNSLPFLFLKNKKTINTNSPFYCNLIRGFQQSPFACVFKDFNGHLKRPLAFMFCRNKYKKITAATPVVIWLNHCLYGVTQKKIN